MKIHISPGWRRRRGHRQWHLNQEGEKLDKSFRHVPAAAGRWIPFSEALIGHMILRIKECGLTSHTCNPASDRDLEVWVVLGLSSIWGVSHLCLHSLPCCSPLSYHDWILLPPLVASFRIIIKCVGCFEKCQKMELLVISRWIWSYLSSSREEFRPSFPRALVCPSMGWEPAETRVQGHSGLSVGDWPLDLVFIQETEWIWAVCQRF